MKSLVFLSCMFLMLASLALAKSSYARFAPAPDEPFDTYGDISWEEEKAHLDNFAIALLQDPGLIGYIIVYAGQRACVDEAQARARRAKKYLVDTRNVPKRRVKWLDGGYREKPTVVLQPVPAGAPALTASPTIKRSEVKIIKHCKRI